VSRYARRVDASQSEVADALRRCGLAVRDLSHAGRGCPDLAVSWCDGRGNRWTSFVEVKTLHTAYGKRLNDAQRAWATGWEGELVTLRTADEAVGWAVNFKARRAA
jgi:hypothetical protein